VPNGNLLVLKKDGLYVFDVRGESGEGTKIWDVEGDFAYANMKLAVSPNGKFIAWSAPGKKSIYLISVNSWDPFSGSMYKVLPYGAYWPIFSPDGEYLAFEEADLSETEVTNPRLVIYSLKDNQKETVLDLNDYYQLSMFITDWR
jgi:Tol biopolymer transport system component